MATDYQQMWTDLGLNLEAHDALLGVLSQAYQDIFLTQKNRPKGMEYFDFVISEVHGLRIKELLDAKAQGRKVVGSFCVFVPEEIILAADGVSVGLCAGAEFGFAEAEQLLPRNTCSLIKSFFGFKLSKVCPYFEACDLVVGENTCDGKKKSYEILRPLVDELHVMDMPQMKSESGKALLHAEYRSFLDKMEELSGKKITVESLKQGIEMVNRKRQAMHRLARLRGVNPAPISGLDALLVNQIFFYDAPARFTDSVNKLCDELEERAVQSTGVRPADTPRILVSGCPQAIPNWKVPAIVESSGAVIVGDESCVGERGMRNEVVAQGDDIGSLLDDLVERYFQIDCAIFTPNKPREEHIREMVTDYKADGVIHYGLQFCGPYQIEAGPVEKALEADSIPVLRLETDYSQEDVGQLQTRVEAFVERIRK